METQLDRKLLTQAEKCREFYRTRISDIVKLKPAHQFLYYFRYEFCPQMAPDLCKNFDIPTGDLPGYGATKWGLFGKGVVQVSLSTYVSWFKVGIHISNSAPRRGELNKHINAGIHNLHFEDNIREINSKMRFTLAPAGENTFKYNHKFHWNPAQVSSWPEEAAQALACIRDIEKAWAPYLQNVPPSTKF